MFKNMGDGGHRKCENLCKNTPSHTREEGPIPLNIRLKPLTALLKSLVDVGGWYEALDKNTTISFEEVDDVFDWGVGRNLLNLGTVLAGSHGFFAMLRFCMFFPQVETYRWRL